MTSVSYLFRFLLIIEPFTQLSKSYVKNEEHDYRILLLHKNVNPYKGNR